MRIQKLRRSITKLNDLIEEEKGNENLIVLGDWNTVIGEGIGWKGSGSIWTCSLVLREERDLLSFVSQRKMVIANTCFEHDKRCRYTMEKTRRYRMVST